MIAGPDSVHRPYEGIGLLSSSMFFMRIRAPADHAYPPQVSTKDFEQTFRSGGARLSFNDCSRIVLTDLPIKESPGQACACPHLLTQTDDTGNRRKRRWVEESETRCCRNYGREI